MTHFKLISSTKAYDVIPVNKYVSEKTGITVIIANVEGPIVNGFFCLATEAHDDDGLPHTLEHLIFLGSKRYPYKGVLDLLANRCMAQGTNAWTDTDHTCYTIHTAGYEGMLTLLPIYLDHILRPTLSDQGYISEVHHIDGDGQDGGVVYCEMQGRENSADSRCERSLLRAMYPDSGYSSETGGIMENLRTSTDNAKVREFHKKFYRPENLTVILTGQIEAEDVFKSLEMTENDIIAEREKENLELWVKPWQQIPPPPMYGEHTVQWPADTEDCGKILFGWRGPLLTEPGAVKQLSACAILLRYLCDTPTAPLQQCLVEKKDALAGDVSYNIIENLWPLIKIEVDNVPVDKMPRALAEARRCLAEARVWRPELERVRRLVRKQLRESLAALDSDAHHAVAFQCIGDAIYSRSEQDFISRLNPERHLRELLVESEDYWLSVLKKYFTDDVVTVLGSPSIQMQTIMADEEEKRIELQKETLGETGLADKAKLLKDAQEFNDRPPTPGMLASVPVPSCRRLRCHQLSTWERGSTPCPHFDLERLPLYARVHSLNTTFVYINIILDVTACDHETRLWLPLFLNSLAECPVKRDDLVVPHDEIVATNEQLAVQFRTRIGLNSSGNFSVAVFGNFIRIELRCEPDDYEEAVNHLYEILYSAVFTKERLLVFTQRLINEVAQVRRSGSKMSSDALRDLAYSTDSNVHWCTVLRQHTFLRGLLERLTAGGDCARGAVQAATAAVRRLTAAPWLHLAADLQRYTLATQPWEKFAAVVAGPPTEPKLYWDADLMKESSGGFVMGVGGVESNFLMQFSPGPRGYELEDIAPLQVAINYFTQVEGPMWKVIRGGGFSYAYDIRLSQSEGSLIFSLYKAVNTVAAYTKAKTIVDEFLSSGDFDEELFTSAKSAAVFEAVECVKCPADVIHQSLLNYCRRVPDTYDRDAVCALAAVDKAAAGEAARRWLPAMFQPGGATVGVACHPAKVLYTQASFDKINVKLEAYESMEASHFNK